MLPGLGLLTGCAQHGSFQYNCLMCTSIASSAQQQNSTFLQQMYNNSILVSNGGSITVSDPGTTPISSHNDIKSKTNKKLLLLLG